MVKKITWLNPLVLSSNLGDLSSIELGKLAEAITDVSCAVRQFVFKQGDDGDCMYIVKSVGLLYDENEGMRVC